MDRSSVTRWIFIAGAILFSFFVLPKFFGHGDAKPQPMKFESQVYPKTWASTPETTCDLWGDRFHAQIGSKGASVKSFELLPTKYHHNGKPIDLVTTPTFKERRQLRFHFRNEAAHSDAVPWQVDYDLLDWQLTRSDGKSCEFSYQDERVRLTKKLSSTSRPYEIAASATIENISDKTARHALTVDTVEWRTSSETQSKMFRQSPFVTHVECVSEAGNAKRLMNKDFSADKFTEDTHFGSSQVNQGDWYQFEGQADIAAASNAYFTHALIPTQAPSPPVCQLQIEERWDNARYKSVEEDPLGGAMYRARIAYAPMDLEPGKSATYDLISYVGPKERDLLAGAGGGKHRLSELIDLGFFTIIAKVLVAFLLKVHSVVHNWGLAIVVLTVTARTLLFPLALPSIRTMIKTRELKPEIDALNTKYKDDPQAKGLAQMELWRKHGINPLKGCLPQLASMPVWFALYTTLQTAVELYNTPFLWFKDLSAPDPYYVLPFIIGATSFVQQKMMPMQGGDPAQQKMMLYFMPAMFTVMMLLLPAGLGVYMFTNGVLGIIQQQSVEWHARRALGKGKGDVATGKDIQIKLKEPKSDKRSDDKKGGPKTGAKLSKLSDERPLLDKGKA